MRKEGRLTILRTGSLDYEPGKYLGERFFNLLAFKGLKCILSRMYLL